MLKLIDFHYKKNFDKTASTKKRKYSAKFKSNGVTDGKLIEIYIHCSRAAKNTRVDMEFTTAKPRQGKLIKDGYLYILKKNLPN